MGGCMGGSAALMELNFQVILLKKGVDCVFLSCTFPSGKVFFKVADQLKKATTNIFDREKPVLVGQGNENDCHRRNIHEAPKSSSLCVCFFNLFWLVWLLIFWRRALVAPTCLFITQLRKKFRRRPPTNIKSRLILALKWDCIPRSLDQRVFICVFI